MRFGIIGVGNITPVHAAAIQGVADSQLVAVATRDPNRGRDFVAKFGGEWHSDYHDLLKRDDVEAVTLCTPHQLHLPMTLDAAAAKKHVLCEKPMARNIAECDQMIAACERSGVTLGVIFQFRFESLARRLKTLIDENKLGNLIWSSASMIWHRTDAYYDSGEWRRTWEGGGGVMINQAIHSIDLMLWLSGMPKRITAQMRTLTHQIDVEDAAIATLEYDGGRLGLVQATTAAYPGYPERLEFFGVNGGAIYHKGQGRLEWHIAHPKEDGFEEAEVSSGAARPMDITATGHILQFQDFAQAIREKRSPLVDGREGRKSMQVVDAIYRSAREQSPVEL